MKNGWQYVQVNGTNEKVAPMTLVNNVLTSENGVSLANAMPANPNLLINGDFQVWQRGTHFTSGNYGPDRWGVFDSPPQAIQQWGQDSPAVSASSLRVTTRDDTWNIVVQPIEMHQALEGKTVTLSFWLFAPSGKYVYYGTGDDSYNTAVLGTGSWQFVSKTNVYTTSGATTVRHRGVKIYAPPSQGVFDFFVTAVKLEMGNIATPFSPRTYAEELAMCQRYYLKDLRTPLYYQSNGYWVCAVQFPVQMRVAPTIATTKYGIIGSFENTLSGHSIARNNDGVVYLNNVSGLATTQLYYVYFIGADAEIY